ncbi:MAG: LrgB family protein, partial [Rhodospirillales bacterium]|nr:LrgB family protein [Rhodospirillales bacterium]
MKPELTEIWVYLSASPLSALTITLVAYLSGDWLYRKAGKNPLLNPVLIAVLMLVGFLLVTGTDYWTYFEGAQFVHFLLGPATVALAVPLYNHFTHVKRSAIAVFTSIVAGSATAAVSAVGIAWALGASKETLISLAPKS